MEHKGIELHDSTIHALLHVDGNVVLMMNVCVHSSTGRPGRDDGHGWFQHAEVVIAGAEVNRMPEGATLRVRDGSVRVGTRRFENLLPLPCDMAGEVELEFHGQKGSVVVKGIGISVKLTGQPGPIEEFRA